MTKVAAVKNNYHVSKKKQPKNNKKKVSSFFTSKKITYVAMLATVSTCVIVLLSNYIPLMIIPSIRISFEGILVKLSGYLFGPWMGLLVGIMTELLVNLIRPSFLHWAYTSIILLYGIFGGVAYLVRHKSKHPIFLSSIIITIFSVVFYGAFLIYIYVIRKDHTAFTFFNDSIAIQETVPVALLAVFFGLIIVFTWIAYLLYKKFNFMAVKNILPILILCFLTEIPAILLSPIGDANTLNGSLTSTSYSLYVGLRLVEFPIRFFMNVIIIYTAWVVLSKIIVRNSRRKQI